MPDTVAQLTRLTRIDLHGNHLTRVPTGVLQMAQLQVLSLSRNALVELPREIAQLTQLKELHVGGNRITRVPREIKQLRALEKLSLLGNALRQVPPELGELQNLRHLLLQNNQLKWLPLEIDDLPKTCKVFLNDNPLPVEVGDANWMSNSRAKLPRLLASTAHLLEPIRERSTELCLGLADLELPALVTLEIIDQAFPNAVRMAAKWDLVVAIKHWHQRRGGAASVHQEV